MKLEEFDQRAASLSPDEMEMESEASAKPNGDASQTPENPLNGEELQQAPAPEAAALGLGSRGGSWNSGCNMPS